MNVPRQVIVWGMGLTSCLMAAQIQLYITQDNNGFAHKPSLSLSQALGKTNIIPIAIIGSGPAGLTAALYGGRARIHTVVFAGDEPGGQLTTTTDIQNWPGFEKIGGQEIMAHMHEQVKHFGAEIVEDCVDRIDFSSWPYSIHTQNNKEAYALTVIIATGASPKKLQIPGEERYRGRGVSTCALCDGPLFEDKNVLVVGGGDSAVEQALQLAPYAQSVTVLVRSPRMRAAPTMRERLAGFSNITIEHNLQITEITGDEHQVTGVKLVNTQTHERMARNVDGIFIAIGHSPNTHLIEDQLHIDSRGYIIIGPDSQKTSKPGVFAAGEVHDDRYRQACVACGQGAMAAIDAIEFLRKLHFNEHMEGLLKTNYFHVKLSMS